MKSWTIWGGLAVLFLSGVLIGGAGTSYVMEAQFESRWEGGPEAKRLWIMKRLTRELHLTVEQQAAIEPIVTRAQVELLTLRAQQRPQVEAIQASSRTAMRAILSPDQQGKLEAFHEKLRRRWQKTEEYLRAVQQDQGARN